MDDVKMLISGVMGERKLVRVSFLRGDCFADGVLPDGIIDRSQGFSDEEVRELEKYLRFNRQDILKQAKAVNPLRNWLMG